MDWEYVMVRMSLVAFVTLTYPAEFPTARASKRDLDVFLKRMKRVFPDVFGFWKLEPQQRGAPHYHLLLAMGDGGRVNNDYLLVQLQEWVPAAWCEVVGSDDARHLQFHVRHKDDVVTEVRSSHGVMKYAGKYVGKAQEDRCDKGDWSHSGRWWGRVNAEGMRDFVKGSFLRVNREAFFMIRRLFRRVSPESVRRSRTARGSNTWWSFDRSQCSNAWGGSFLNQALGYAIPGRAVFSGRGSVKLEFYMM